MNEIRECLIIDDDQDDQEIFRMCIKKVSPDIRCTSKGSGDDAIAFLNSNDYTPNYIFIDVNMPKMNGIDCLKYLKSLDRLKHTKFYMYSTTTGSATIARSIELGAAEFIIKPAKTSDLKEKLSSIFAIVSEIDK